MKKYVALCAVLSALCLCCPQGKAQSKAAGATVAAPAGFRGEFMNQLADVEKKIEDLAQAMPDEKYSWRPMEGVRSVSEVYMHIADANYLFPTFMGMKRPEGLPKDMEKNVTTKPKVLEALKASFSYLRDVVMQTPDSTLDKPANLFGDETTYRGVIFISALHLHEHLGQSIAYARMNKIVPPWTAAADAQQKGK
jgi:uncharacterized damage-inducible protein DinB